MDAFSKSLFFSKCQIKDDNDDISSIVTIVIVIFKYGDGSSVPRAPSARKVVGVEVVRSRYSIAEATSMESTHFWGSSYNVVPPSYKLVYNPH